MAALSSSWLTCLLPWGRHDNATANRSKRAFEVAQRLHRESGGPTPEMRELFRDYARVQRLKRQSEKVEQFKR